MTTLSAYLLTWNPKLSHTNAVTAVLRLYNQDVNLEFTVHYNRQ